MVVRVRGECSPQVSASLLLHKMSTEWVGAEKGTKSLQLLPGKSKLRAESSVQIRSECKGGGTSNETLETSWNIAAGPTQSDPANVRLSSENFYMIGGRTPRNSL